MKPEDVRREIKRLEAWRLRLAPEVVGGNLSAVEEDEGLERRIMEWRAPSGRGGPTS